MRTKKRNWTLIWFNALLFAHLDKDAADKLSKTVDEACLLLAEYNGRLAAELEDRRQLARMLTEYINSQREALSEREKKLEVISVCPHFCLHTSLFVMTWHECLSLNHLLLIWCLQEYKQKLARVTQVRKELKSHIQSLPDLSLLPNVTGGLAPLPSAGDLFSTDWGDFIKTCRWTSFLLLFIQTQLLVWVTEFL